MTCTTFVKVCVFFPQYLEADVTGWAGRDGTADDVTSVRNLNHLAGLFGSHSFLKLLSLFKAENDWLIFGVFVFLLLVPIMFKYCLHIKLNFIMSHR